MTPEMTYKYRNAKRMLRFDVTDHELYCITASPISIRPMLI